MRKGGLSIKSKRSGMLEGRWGLKTEKEKRYSHNVLNCEVLNPFVFSCSFWL